MKIARRSQGWWVDAGIQGRWMAVLGITALGVAAIAAFAVDLGFRELHALGVESGFDPQHDYFVFLNFQRMRILKIVGMGTAGVSALSVLVGLWVSYRVAGPVARLKASVREALRAESLQPLRGLKFRKQDLI